MLQYNLPWNQTDWENRFNVFQQNTTAQQRDNLDHIFDGIGPPFLDSTIPVIRGREPTRRAPTYTNPSLFGSTSELSVSVQFPFYTTNGSWAGTAQSALILSSADAKLATLRLGRRG